MDILKTYEQYMDILKTYEQIKDQMPDDVAESILSTLTTQHLHIIELQNNIKSLKGYINRITDNEACRIEINREIQALVNDSTGKEPTI